MSRVFNSSYPNSSHLLWVDSSFSRIRSGVETLVEMVMSGVVYRSRCFHILCFCECLNQFCQFINESDVSVAGTSSKHTERQSFPEQFSQFTNKFQETFVNPSGGSGSSPFGQVGGNPFGQIPSGFGNPSLPQFSKRQIDTSQFSQFANKFQETFKPPNGMPSFGNFPSPGSTPTFFPQPTKRQMDTMQFSELVN